MFDYPADRAYDQKPIYFYSKSITPSEAID